MGYVICFASCIGCGRMFGCNPNKVPSVRVHGEREPVCSDCVERLNEIRERNGLAKMKVSPEAYEPADENELNWGS